MREPLISVFIPTKNRIELLERSIRSVLSQTYKNHEIIVIDDGSNIPVERYIKGVFGGADKLRFIRNNTSLGACKSRNIGIEAAKGSFVTGLDDDDYFHPRRLERLLSSYNPKYALICSNYYVLRKRGSSRSSFLPRIIKYEDLFNRNCVGNQALVEKDRLIEVGGYDESLKASQDLDLWIRLTKKFGSAKRIAQPLYYMDTSHDSPRITISESRYIGTEQFVKKYHDQLTDKQARYKIDSLGNREGPVSGLKKTFAGPRLYGWALSLEILRHKLYLG